MGLKRYKEKVKEKVKNFFEPAMDYARKGISSAGDWTQRAGDQYTEGYRRYKDPIIIGSATALGAVLGTLLLPGLGTAGGAMLGASLAGGAAGTARGMYTSQKQAKAQEQAMKQSQNIFANAAQRRVSQRTRQGGEGDVSYSTYEDAA